MPTLKQIQQDITHSLLNRNNPAALQHLVNKNISAQDRLAVYRTTLLENLRNTLEITFPDTWKLLGKTCADSVAYAFLQQQKNWPTTACLDDWGGTFPSFLGTVAELKALVYLQDIAHIEWYKHRSYCAANTRPLPTTKLAHSLQGDLEKLQLRLHPSVYLHAANYLLAPIFSLLENAENSTPLELISAPSFALIHRPKREVTLEWLPYGLFKLLFLIKTKKNTLLQAYSAILTEEPQFNLTHALQFMLEKELLWQYQGA